MVQAALEVLPAAEVIPEGHAVQLLAPADEYVLGGHCAHEPEARYWPALQEVVGQKLGFAIVPVLGQKEYEAVVAATL